MRILAACDWFSPATGGGAERVAWEVYRRLAADGHQVVVVATTPDSSRFAHDLPHRLHVVPVRAIDLSGLLRAQVSLALGLERAFSTVVEALRPQVIHANSLQFQTTPVAARTAHRAGIPLVITGHIGGLDALRGPLGAAARVHERLVGRRSLRAADRAIAVSDPVREHLASLAPSVPIEVVPNGVDHAAFGVRPSRERTGPFRALLVGRLVPNKGPDTAVEAMGILRERDVAVHLDIVGEGPLRDRLEQRVRTLGLTGHVTFHGHREDMAAWYAASDVLLRPSLTEGMPLSLLEAMCARVPVVASDIPGNRSLVVDGSTGLLVPPGDPHRLADAIERLLRDPASSATLVARAATSVAGQTWEACAAGTLAVLERAAHRNRA